MKIPGANDFRFQSLKYAPNVLIGPNYQKKKSELSNSKIANPAYTLLRGKINK